MRSGCSADTGTTAADWSVTALRAICVEFKCQPIPIKVATEVVEGVVARYSSSSRNGTSRGAGRYCRQVCVCVERNCR